VRYFYRAVVTCLAVSALAAWSGCGNSPSPASMKGPGGSQPTATSSPTPTTSATATQDSLHPSVVFETSQGSFTVQLDYEKARLTADNFLAYVDSGHYDQTIVHQVLKDYPKLIMAGAFANDLSEKKSRTPIYNEAHNGLKNKRGTIAMARQPDDINSATCTFYINLSDNEVLDHKDRTPQGYGYCVFGEVTSGLDVVEKIAQVPVRDTDKFEHLPSETVLIKSAHRLR
jgi:cyclophilin family peptidyl-prolyl cis-trans isomerase